MDNLCHITLEGPFALLSSDDTLNPAFTEDADRPGLYLWTFEVKQAHRLHFVGSAADSVTAANTTLLANCLGGQHTIFNTARLFEGEIEVLFDPTDPQHSFSEDTMREQLRGVNLFYGCPDMPARALEELCDALLQRYIDFGQTASKWLEPSLMNNNLIASGDRTLAGTTVRFHRPAFIVSLPDDMNL